MNKLAIEALLAGKTTPARIEAFLALPLGTLQRDLPALKAAMDRIAGVTDPRGVRAAGRVSVSAQCEVTGKRAAQAPLSFFERYLTIWVFICIVVGIVGGGIIDALEEKEEDVQ